MHRLLWPLVAVVVLVDASSLMLNYQQDPVCRKLEKWIEDNGGVITSVKCRTQPETGGRGLIAVNDLQYRQTYITVPMKLWMHERTVIQISDIGKILDTDEHLKTRCGKTWGASGEPCRLIIAAMYEYLNPESHWRAYLDSWPEHPTSPVWFTEEQLDALQSDVVKEEVQTLQNYLSDHYDATFPYLIKTYPQYFNKNFTLELLTWASLHVWGRAFDASAQDPKRPRRRTWGMIPFADLVNHGSHVESFYGDTKGKGPFSCWATQCFKAGAELLQSYGSHRSSTHFFLFYGFVPTGYLRADYIALRLPYEEYQKLPKSSGNFKRPHKGRTIGFAGIDGRLTENFIASTREVLRINDKIPEKDMKESHGYITTLKHILKVVKDFVKSWKTTRKQDFEELSKPFETYEKWATLTFRSRYKYVVEQLVQGLEHRIKKNPTSTRGWLQREMDWLMVYDKDEVSESKAESAARDSMNVLMVSCK
eukprot:m.336496 g.336496  ORF g.336496 m.336496 type:complete len:479 (-) comp17869_c0_seq1:95-1531(-)